MARDMLTGTRIRERRVSLGMKQAKLAEDAQISASYLNLIEHNRRRIGGKLLVAIARILEVEPASLTEGAEIQLINAIRAAGETAQAVTPEIERAEEFAGRFPGWAGLLREQSERMAEHERTIDSLTDRLAHDPQLAAALHEILSTVTAIRSTAGILADDPDIAPEWRARFHRNINEEAARLSDSSTELVRYLEAEEENGPLTPQDEMDAFLKSVDYRVDALEAGASVEQVLEEAAILRSDASRELARGYLVRYARDARRLPFPVLSAARGELGDDPAAIAARCDVPLDTALHRLALHSDVEAGLVICSAGGAITFRKPLAQLVLAHKGNATTLWPIYAALSQPGTPIRRIVHQAGQDERQFETFSYAAIVGAPVFDAPPKVEAIMLIRPKTVQSGAEATGVLPMGGLG